jgi:hypothetical protein
MSSVQVFVSIDSTHSRTDRRSYAVLRQSPNSFTCAYFPALLVAQNIMWRAMPLLGNDRKVSKYTTEQGERPPLGAASEQRLVKPVTE